MLRCFVVVAFLALFPCPAPSCSLCPSPINRFPLGAEIDRADLVFYGRALNPKPNLNPNDVPGSGTTELHIEKVLKPHAILKDKMVLLDRYLPVLDPKDPPRFIVFCDVLKDKLNPYVGRPTKTPAVLDYLEGAKAERAKGRLATLAYCAKFFNHADELVADDAFIEFAKANDDEVGNVARHLDRGRLRKLLDNPKLDADRISLFSFLLGGCGEPGDADYLRQRIVEAKSEDLRALDGLLAGYIAMRPKEGWTLTLDVLANDKGQYARRFAALRAIRFYQGWKPADTLPHILKGYQTIIPDGEMADLAIEDLRRWKTWDLTKAIVEQYGRPTHNVPIIKRSILRYALCCPAPEAVQFVKSIEGKEKRLLEELRESIQFEKQ